jgi:acetyl-CoA acetyltransferase
MRPHLLNGSRTGIRYGAGELVDHMAWDGLTNPYDGKAMGVFGDAACAKYGFTARAVDAYAARASSAPRPRKPAGAFDGEIVRSPSRPARARWWSTRTSSRARSTHRQDPRPACGLRQGRHVLTAASSSKISDGAAALVLMSSADAAAAGADSRWRASLPMPRMRRPRNGSPPPRSPRSERARQGRLEVEPTSTCSRSTKPSPGGDGADDASSASRTTSST